MRTGVLGVLLACLLVAGCLSSTPKEGSPAPLGTAGPDGYSVDCSIGSSDWAEPCLAWASRNDSPSKAEVDIAVSPQDPKTVFVASKDLDPKASSCVWAVGQVTHDGGHTWKTVYIGGTEDERKPTDPLWGWSCITDPILQFSRDGKLHYSLQVYDYMDAGGVTGALPVGAEGGNMYQAVSSDHGDSFPSIQLMHVGDAGLVYHDYMRMATNPTTGTVFTLWNQITGTQTVFPVVVAMDEGGRVRPPVYFASPGAAGALGLNAIAGAPDGTVYVVVTGAPVNDASPQTVDPGDVYVSTSTDDGLTFTVPTVAFHFTPMRDLENVKFRTGSSVEIAIDASEGPHKGCLYATYPDGAADPADVSVRSSCDKGATWSDPVLVSNVSRDGAQFFPRISVDGHGTVHIVYLSQGYDPEHRLVDAEWAHSTDGGKTWTQARLTQVSSDGDLGLHQDGFPFFGDYIGISSTGDHTYMGFPVTDTGRAELAVAHVLAG